jgi:hypothetical protein
MAAARPGFDYSMINACRRNLEAHSYGAGAGAPAAEVLGAVSTAASMAVRARGIAGRHRPSSTNARLNCPLARASRSPNQSPLKLVIVIGKCVIQFCIRPRATAYGRYAGVLLLIDLSEQLGDWSGLRTSSCSTSE